MIKKAHTILYVQNQELSTLFYRKLLGCQVKLNVPGMTEIELMEDSILGLMPSKGIVKLLDNKIDEPVYIPGQPKAELYFIVSDIGKYIKNAVEAGAFLIDDLKLRDWGHKAVYYKDPDGNIIAFAEETKER
ncbi:MAG: lactoylglutathione lyase [Flavobacterium sp.]|nr:lactoylglutathione lyase [Flavobacterium sp.]